MSERKNPVDELRKIAKQVAAEYGTGFDRAIKNNPDLSNDFGEPLDYADVKDKDTRFRAYQAFKELLKASPAAVEATVSRPLGNRKLAPLEYVVRRDDDPITSIADLRDRWVWVTGIKLFVKRADTSMQWDMQQFDAAFSSWTDTASISKQLHKKDLVEKFDRQVFRPNEPEWVGRDYNTWRASPIVAVEGDTTLWNAHCKFLVPDDGDRAKMLDWFAGVLQAQEKKPMHALFLWGKVPGTGKSFMFDAFKRLLGELNCQVLTQDILASGFTGWAMRTKLVVVEEIRSLATKEVKHTLHPWITQKDITVHDKHIRAFKTENVLAFGFMSNKGDYPLDNDDRRYAVIETPAKVHALGAAYYGPLYATLSDPAALAAIKWELEHRDLAKAYPIQGPAPPTVSKATMMVAGRDDLKTWLHEHPPNDVLVTLDDMIAGLPHGIRRSGSYAIIREFVKDECDGVWLGECRLDGRSGTRVNLWAVNAKGSLPAAWAKHVKELEALGPADRGRHYLAQGKSPKSDFEEE